MYPPMSACARSLYRRTRPACLSGVNALSVTSDVSGDSGVTRAYHTVAAVVAAAVLVDRTAGRVQLGIVERAASSLKPAGIGGVGPWRWLEVGRKHCRLPFGVVV